MQKFAKITVIGGSGFVGTNLCQELADRKIPFEILDIKKSRRFGNKCKIADVRDIQSLRETITGDVVVHLAAAHRDDIQDKSEYVSTNVHGAENVAKICTEKNIRKIVFTSSVAVYGFAIPGTDETGAINPFNEYGKTKFQAEQKFRIWSSEGNNRLIIIRPTVIFGEGNRGNVYNLIKQISSGAFFMIGSGKNFKSMAYIGNVVEFILKCIETDREYAVFNYVDTPDWNMNKFVRYVRFVLRGSDGVGFRLPRSIGMILGYAADGVARLTRKRLPLSSIRVRKFCSPTVFGSAKEELDGFIAPFTLQEGIDRTLRSEFISPDPGREIFFTE